MKTPLLKEICENRRKKLRKMSFFGENAEKKLRLILKKLWKCEETRENLE